MIRGITLKLSREEVGIVMDALFQHLEGTKRAQSQWGSGSENRIAICEQVIKAIGILVACSEVPNA